MKPWFPIEVPWDARSVPHATIEVNQMCNIACDGCYKNKSSYTKTVDQVKEEVDIAAAERRLESITLLGGEPTLHPDLGEIIRYIAGKGIYPIVLTNGSRLTPERLRTYKAAGVFAVRIHIDRHQRGRPDCAEAASEEMLNPLRLRYIAMCRDARIEAFLALTLYRDTLDDLPGFMMFCHRHRVRDVLFTLYLPSANGHRTQDGADASLVLNNKEIYDFLAEREATYPMWYVPSTKNPTALRWMTYFASVTVNSAGDYTRLFLHPRFRRALDLHRAISRLTRVRYSFSALPGAGLILTLFLPYALLSFSVPAVAECGRFLWAAFRNGNVSCFRMVFQELPFLEADGDFDSCKNCPDATVRHGKLVPVCLADHLNPILTSNETTAGAASASFASL